VYANRYEDRKVLIGERIFEEREKKGWTRKDLLLKIHKSAQSHKSVKAWETGKCLPDLGSIVLMAKAFDCDIGYLLCDYDEKRYFTADVSEQTGLSIEAVERINDMNRFGNIPVEVLSCILTHPDTEELLHRIFELAQIKNACTRVAATQNSSKRNKEYASNAKAQRALQELEEKEEGKVTRISRLFGNVSEKVASQLSSTPHVSEKGASIAKRVLNPEEWILYQKYINEMMDETFSKEE